MALRNGNPKHKLTVEEQRKGGQKSVEARAEKKLLKECLIALLNEEVAKDKNGNSITATEAMAAKAVKEAIKGNWKAWELVRDTSGQKPVEKVAVSEIEPDVMSKVEDIVNAEREEQ